MLCKLHISNYALIRELDIGFEAGFSVITGETGAGKSILLGALGLVLGNRADSLVLMDKDRKCVVEAVFTIADLNLQAFFHSNDLDYSADCILRREISPTGKSRAFINDSPVNLTQLKSLGDSLVDVHSQHESLQLSEAGFQLRILDDLSANEDLRAKFETLYGQHRQLSEKIAEMEQLEKKHTTEQDFLRFQYEELDKAQLQAEEYEAIEGRLNLLQNAGEIESLRYQVARLLEEDDSAIIPGLHTISGLLSRLQRFLPSSVSLSERLQSSLIDLKDIALEINRMEAETQFDPAELEQLSQRLDLLNHLLHKHRLLSVGELIGLKEKLRGQLTKIDGLADELDLARKQLDKLTAQMKAAGMELRESRKKTAPHLAKAVEQSLQSLGMPNALFELQFEQLDEPMASGYDRVQFLFTANKGARAENIARIASGGEMSRLMLAIKSLISAKKLMPTIIFDEIDTGVSGEIAGKVGRIMAGMADRMQLISITHLPQIAGKARHHYLVYKHEVDSRTTSMLVKLTDDQRVEEIARMLSDASPTQASIMAARELISG